MDIYRNQKIPQGKWKGMHSHPKPMGCSKSSSMREVYSSIILHYESIKISDNLIFHLKILEKEWTNPEVTIKKEIINIRKEVNEIEMRKTIEKIYENKNRLFENIKKLIKLYLGSSSKWKWAYYTKRSKSERKTRGGRWEWGSGRGTRVYPWWIHVDVWQNQYNIVK